MDWSCASAAVVARPQGSLDARLNGRWLTIAHVVATALALLTAVLFVVGIPASFAYLQVVCADPACNGSQPTPATVRALGQLGVPIALYAAYLLMLDVIFALVCFALAGLIARHMPVSRLALLGALALVTFGGATFPIVLRALAETHHGWALPIALVSYTGHVSFLSFFYLFPDGAFIPRWTRPLALLWAVLGIPIYFVPGTPLDPHASPAAFVPMYLGFLGMAIFAQVYRYRRVSSLEQRQQTKWVVFGFATALLTFLAFILVGAALPPSLGQNPLGFLVGNTIMHVSMLLIPLSIGVAILKYRLWGIDLIINRALVYGSLTTCVIGAYVLVVGGLGTLLQARGNLIFSLAATGLIAVAFQPLRDHVQQTVNRLMYGERDEPYSVLSRLGHRLEATLAPAAVLPTIVQTVRDALRLPYAAIALKHGDHSRLTAHAGTLRGVPVRLPLLYQGEPVGELLLAPRTGEEGFGSADQRLIDDVARHAGVAVHAVRLTADLQHSRERLVTTREEERRRLRRDLHDGLGPVLAGFTLQVGAIRNLLRRDPDAVDELLVELGGEAEAAVGEVRRLVYALRPPVLDELGLLGAIQARASQYGRDGLQVRVEAPEHLPPLPAAVEVAAYRIVQEALANVVRHARASTCLLRVALEEGVLRVEVRDNGTGLSPGRKTGVGLHSMRERAEELGGRCVVQSPTCGGTYVLAELPLPRTLDDVPRVGRGQQSDQAGTVGDLDREE